MGCGTMVVWLGVAAAQAGFACATARWAGKARPGCASRMWSARSQSGAQVGLRAGVAQASKDVAEVWRGSRGAGNDCRVVSGAGTASVRAHEGGRGRADARKLPCTGMARTRSAAHGQRSQGSCCYLPILLENLVLSRSGSCDPDCIVAPPGLKYAGVHAGWARCQRRRSWCVQRGLPPPRRWMKSLPNFHASVALVTGSCK